MVQRPVTKSRLARLLNAGRRIALMLTIVVAVPACGGGGSAGGASVGGEVPNVCQDARKAFSDWLAADLAREEATGKAVTDSAFVNVELSTIRLTGDASRKEFNGLVAKVNASLKAALEKADKASRLYKAFTPLFNACLALKGVKLPPACASELGQYPTVTAAQTKIAQAQTTALNKITAVRAAMIARDKRAEDAARKQTTAATAQLNAALKNWNTTVLPKYAAAVKGCNKAIS